MAKDLKIFAKTIEDEALQQIETLLAQPAFSDCKVRIMPDVHAGKGCVVGFTANLGKKVIPNIVGVDIGCGMYCVPIGPVDIDFDKLDGVIRRHIPCGMNVNEKPVPEFYSWMDIENMFCYDDLKNIDWIERSLCSLGGGNHFIEVDVGDEGNKYLVVHTGSRNLGKQVAEIYQNMAIDRMGEESAYIDARNKLIAEYKKNGIEKHISRGLAELKKAYRRNKSIPDDLCYLESGLRDMYLFDMRFCQYFAHYNRYLIAKTICDKMGWPFYEETAFDTVHNYIDLDNNIVRKGAISAKKGEKLTIPINMRDGCIIGIGKGNKDWNESAPHGAGRVMSRKKAKESINMSEFQESMSGIYSTSVCAETLDEAPQAYKPMEDILDCIGDTVQVERIIKPVYNFKAS